MKDEKFWNMLEKQNSEKKEENWKKFKFAEKSENVQEENVFFVKQRHFRWTYKRVVSVCASVILLLGISVSAGIYIKSQKNIPVEHSCFCRQEDYSLYIGKTTFKERAAATGKDFLYFDWYDNNEHLMDYTYELIDTREVLGFREELQNAETHILTTLVVTDNRTMLEEFDLYDDLCIEQTTIADVAVAWGLGDYGYAQWEYKGFRYYLEIDVPESGEDLLEFVRELLT